MFDDLRSRIVRTVAPRATIEHNHRYESVVTDAEFFVTSIGTHAEIEISHFNHTVSRSVPIEHLEFARAIGLVEHASTCTCSGFRHEQS